MSQCEQIKMRNVIYVNLIFSIPTWSNVRLIFYYRISKNISMKRLKVSFISVSAATWKVRIWVIKQCPILWMFSKRYPIKSFGNSKPIIYMGNPIMWNLSDGLLSRMYCVSFLLSYILVCVCRARRSRIKCVEVGGGHFKQIGTLLLKYTEMIYL